MKYYCPECKSEYKFKDEPPNTNNWCPICYFKYTNYPTEVVMKLIPDFETPQQYEKRTGKKWNGAVWFRYKLCNEDKWSEWQAHNPLDTTTDERRQFLCATSSEPPPDDYVPEEEA